MTEEQDSTQEGRQLLDDLKALEEALQNFRHPGRLAEPADPHPETPRSRVGPPDSRAARSRSSYPPPAWGWFAASTLVCACMLGLVSLGDALSRSGHRFGGIPFWLGLTIPVSVIAFRQASPNVARSERLALLFLIGIFLYLVKVLRDPFVFDFADEFNQAYNTTQLLNTRSLFGANPLLPATADYPGLASLIAALASLTHLSVFSAGLIVIAVARTIMILAVYLLLERATNSPQVAGLGALVYTSAPNFLFFTAEVSYESLALPLAAAAMYVVISWSDRRAQSSAHWAVAGLILVAAVIPSHHMTSYVLIGSLLGLSLAHWFARRGLRTSAFPFALYALLLTTGWLVFVASRTVGYLEPVFTDALRSTLTVIANEGTGTRKPFTAAASSEGSAVPLWDRWSALASAVLIIALVPFGLYRAWQRHRRIPVVAVLAIAAIGYLATFGLRLVPSAWEIASRSSEFLFVGVGLMIALALARPPGGMIRGRAYRVGVACVVSIIFIGGAAVGWRPEIRLAQAIRVKAGDSDIEPQGLTAARWSRRWISPDTHGAFGADGSNSRLLLVYGRQFVRTGGIGGADLAVELPKLEPWQIQLLRDKSIRYVLMDRRAVADDQLAGYFFPTKISPAGWRKSIPMSIYGKFDRRRASRLFDSGNVTIYDVSGLVGSPSRG